MDCRDPERRVTREELARVLSAEEKAALAALAHDPPRRAIPAQEERRLLTLGLAELWCGRLVLTSAGAQAVAMLRDT